MYCCHVVTGGGNTVFVSEEKWNRKPVEKREKIWLRSLGDLSDRIEQKKIGGGISLMISYLFVPRYVKVGSSKKCDSHSD
jgi:hypothetical protein